MGSLQGNRDTVLRDTMVALVAKIAKGILFPYGVNVATLVVVDLGLRLQVNLFL